MKLIRAKHTIRHNNITYKHGAIIDGLSKSEEERLVRLKAAEYVLSPEEELRKQQAKGNKTEISQEEFKELREALDAEYNAEELKRAAKAVGVDLNGASTKAEVIAAIINQGKADELLEDDTDE
jgi:hypothetical protein